MEQFVVSITSGISLGGVYTLIALGVVVAYRATGTFNFAHGELVTLAAFVIASKAASWGTPAAFVLALVAPAVVTALFYLVVLKNFSGGASNFAAVIATLGLGSILDGALVLLFGNGLYKLHFPGLPTGTVTIFNVNVASSKLVIAVIAIVITIALSLTLRWTAFGRSLFAAGQNPLLASQGGINIRLIQVAAWTLAGVLAGIGGIAFASTNAVDASVVALAFAAFPAILIGGMDSILGALIGSLIIGLSQGFMTTYVGPDYVNLVTYGLLLVVLLIKPNGLFGTRHVTRV